MNNKPTLVERVDQLLAYDGLLKITGKDGKPTDQNLIFFRGVTEVDQLKQFQGSGPHYPGKGAYGNGTYAAAQTNGDPMNRDYAFREARAYAAGKSEAVTAFGLRADAKILDLTSPEWTHKGYNDRYVKYAQSEERKGVEHTQKDLLWSYEGGAESVFRQTAQRILKTDVSDIGELAAMLGYDGMKVRTLAGDWGQDFWVFFNRNKLVMLEGGLDGRVPDVVSWVDRTPWARDPLHMDDGPAGVIIEVRSIAKSKGDATSVISKAFGVKDVADVARIVQDDPTQLPKLRQLYEHLKHVAADFDFGDMDTTAKEAIKGLENLLKFNPSLPNDLFKMSHAGWQRVRNDMLAEQDKRPLPVTEEPAGLSPRAGIKPKPYFDPLGMKNPFDFIRSLETQSADKTLKRMFGISEDKALIEVFKEAVKMLDYDRLMRKLQLEFMKTIRAKVRRSFDRGVREVAETVTEDLIDRVLDFNVDAEVDTEGLSEAEIAELEKEIEQEAEFEAIQTLNDIPDLLDYFQPGDLDLISLMQSIQQAISVQGE